MNDKSLFELEFEVIERFVQMKNPKEKKYIALAKKIMTEVDNKIVLRLCKDILNHRDRMGFIKRTYELLQDYYILKEKFLAEGKHGMIIHEAEAYPIELKTQPHWLDKDWKWCPTQEQEIRVKVTEEFMLEHNLLQCCPKVFLFEEFGFSGVPVFVPAFFRKVA